MKSKFCLSLLLALSCGTAGAIPCERWLIYQERWEKDRQNYQVISSSKHPGTSDLAAAEFGRYARQVYTPQGFQDGTILAAANRLLSLAEDYLSLYRVNYELWHSATGDDYRLHFLPGNQSALNKAVQKIEDRYGLQVFFSPTASFYQQQEVFIDEAQRALYLGHQNLTDLLRFADFPLLYQIITLEIEHQYNLRKSPVFWGSFTVHGHGVNRLFKALKTQDDYFKVDWSDIYALWQELAVMAKNLARGRGLDGHNWTSSAEEEIAYIQTKIEDLKLRYSFIELAYKNMLAPFLKWHWRKVWRVSYWRQAFQAHNLNGLKQWPRQEMAAMQDALAAKAILLIEKDTYGQDRLHAIFSFSHEGKRWTTIRLPLDESTLGPEFDLAQIERIPAVKAAAQQQAARQFMQHVQVLLLLQDTLDFLNRPDIASQIYFNYANARQELAQQAAQVLSWNDPAQLKQALAATPVKGAAEPQIKNQD